MTSKANLYAALARAQRGARAVGQDSKNQHQGYKYASAESLLDEGRKALAEQGLVFVATRVRCEMVEPPFVVVTYLLGHESGEQLEYERSWPAIEQKGRPLDKAVAGALTSGLGYAVRDLLLLPRDDDFAAMDRRDDRTHEPALPPARAADSRPPPAESGSGHTITWLIARLADVANGQPIEPFIDGPFGEALAIAESAFAKSAKTEDFATLGKRARDLPQELSELVLDAIEPAYKLAFDRKGAA